MFNEIGLNANFNMKKERMINREIDINTNSIYPLVDNMLDSRKTAIDKINEMYGLSITVELNSSWAERYEDLDVIDFTTSLEEVDADDSKGDRGDRDA